MLTFQVKDTVSTDAVKLAQCFQDFLCLFWIYSIIIASNVPPPKAVLCSLRQSLGDEDDLHPASFWGTFRKLKEAMWDPWILPRDQQRYWSV